jgi:hypothetical protein
VLLTKARALGLRLPNDLQRLAVVRGCSYYVVEAGPLPASTLPFTNAELAVALLSPALPPEPQDIRIAAAVLSSPDVGVASLVALAEGEGCAGLVRYIAECGRKYEPEIPFWQELLERLGDAEVPPGPLPHPTRFIEMTGMVRGKIGLFTHWIRPAPAAA